MNLAHGLPPASVDSRQGFTLTELIVAMGISIVVLAGVTAAFITQTSEYRRHRNAVEMHQNANTAASRILYDLRMAGYGLPIRASELSNWITWVSGTTNTIRIVQGVSGAPDRLFIAGALGNVAGRLATTEPRAATTIRLQPGQGPNFNTTNRKLILIDHTELARVTGVSGNNLTITEHPSLSGRGLQTAHAAGAPVELIQVVEYACDATTTNALRRPYLYRNDYRGILTNRLQQLVALGIEDFQITTSSNLVSLTLTGVSQNPEFRYIHPTRGDPYRRVILNGSATSRNPVN